MSVALSAAAKKRASSRDAAVAFHRRSGQPSTGRSNPFRAKTTSAMLATWTCSTRRLAVTELGREYYQRCLDVLHPRAELPVGDLQRQVSALWRQRLSKEARRG